MSALLNKIAQFFWPELEFMSPNRRVVGVGDVIISLYGSLLSIVGLGWLIARTDSKIIAQQWPMLLLLTALIVIFTRLSFFLIVEFRADRYGSSDGSFDSMMVWSAVLLFGATALWPMILLALGAFLYNWRNMPNRATRWNQVRATALTIAGFTLPYLVALSVYERLGGTYPIPDLMPQTIWLAVLAIIVNFFVFSMIWGPYFAYALQTQQSLAGGESLKPVVVFFLLALALPTLANPFAILASGLYVQNGIFTYIFFIAGLILVAYLARKFSWVSEGNRQQSRQLEKLEQLGRALLNSPPDASALPEILQVHVPAMFPSGNIAIWLVPGQILYKGPLDDWPFNVDPIQDWLFQQSEAHAFLPSESLPWGHNLSSHRPIVVAPISAHEGGQVIGGFYMELRTLAQPWDHTALQRLFPAVHSLSDQIASTRHQAEEYAQSLAYQSMAQELRLAGQIQASFIPNEFPSIPAYQLAVTLEPARGLSGDFFDLIPLSRGRLGILVADVADKGLGAALYMALSRTLLRTYALEYQSRPDIVLSEVNERILSDARANLFVTVFYGILDPTEHTLTYSNAGHNPAYLLSSLNQRDPLALIRTGMPIGIDEENAWENRTVNIEPGDVLLLYTDGVPDAQNAQGEFFDQERLLDVTRANLQGSAYDLQDAILNNIRAFVGDAPQFDDITLLILARDA